MIGRIQRMPNDCRRQGHVHGPENGAVGLSCVLHALPSHIEVLNRAGTRPAFSFPTAPHKLCSHSQVSRSTLRKDSMRRARREAGNGGKVVLEGPEVVPKLAAGIWGRAGCWNRTSPLSRFSQSPPRTPAQSQGLPGGQCYLKVCHW